MLEHPLTKVVLMEIEFIESFLETAAHTSMAKASAKLNISQPALSKQIKKLESYYGVELLKRSPSGIELTEEGYLVVEKMRPLLQQIHSIKKEISSRRPINKLAIGTLPSIAAHYLPRRLLHLEENNIKSEVHFRNTSKEILELLNLKLIDCAIMERIDLHNSLWCKDLFTEPFFVVVSKDHPLAMKPIISLSDIIKEPMILYPPECSIRNKITVLLKEKYGGELNLRTEVNFGEFILSYVEAGAGITIVPKLICDHMNNLNLTKIQIAEPEACRTISLVSNSKASGKLLYEYLT